MKRGTNNLKASDMTTLTERRKFIAETISEDLLDGAIDWIRTNMEPDEIFEERVLDQWAEDNGFVKGGNE